MSTDSMSQFWKHEKELEDDYIKSRSHLDMLSMLVPTGSMGPREIQSWILQSKQVHQLILYALCFL